MKHLSIYGSLCRFKVSLFAACSALTGYILATESLTPSAVILVVGVFLLACGASALNQYQERKLDARMERTKKRPIPSGAMPSGLALTVSIILIVSGIFLLLYSSGLFTFLLGLIALLWYNGIYTWLKRVTAFAAAPGALVGIFPLAIGWTSAGNSMIDARLVAICTLFFLWQVPHFWLLFLQHEDEYAQAGFPSLTERLSRKQISKITFVWIAATVAVSMALPLYGMPKSVVACLFLAVPSLWLLKNGFHLLGATERTAAYGAIFRSINIFMLVVLATLSLDGLLSS